MKTQDYYSINKISEIFGVSPIRINKWIQEGRFIPLDPKHIHKRIASNTLWLTKKGRLFSLAEIIEEWEHEQKNLEENKDDGNEVKFLVNQMRLYEMKYQGSFEDTLGKVKNKTAEEETDSLTWKYLKKRLKKNK